LSNYELYIYPRKNSNTIPKSLQGHPRIKINNAPQIEISSSEIRERIKKGKDVSELIPKMNWKFIKERGFYKF
jgi:nicotinate-nucleotide adenylyltransferase